MRWNEMTTLVKRVLHRVARIGVDQTTTGGSSPSFIAEKLGSHMYRDSLVHLHSGLQRSPAAFQSTHLKPLWYESAGVREARPTGHRAEDLVLRPKEARSIPWETIFQRKDDEEQQSWEPWCNVRS